MKNRCVILGLPLALILAPSLGAQQPTTASIDPAARARTALPQGAAPQGLVATASSPTSVRLSWTSAPGATGYLVYRGASADTSTAPIATVPPSVTAAPAVAPRQRTLSVTTLSSTPPTSSVSYLDNGVMPHSTVYYRVAATYEGLRTGTSEAVSATTPTAPQPTGLTAFSGLGSVTLKWQPAAGATSYSVTREATSNVLAAPINGNEHIHDTTYTDEDAFAGYTYVYRVRAYYTVQGIGEVTGDTTQVPAVLATPRRSSPKDFRMDPYNGGTDITFRWTPFQFDRWEQYGKVTIYTANSYKILRALASDGNFAEVPGIQYSGLHGDPRAYEFARDNTVQVGATYLYKLETIYSGPPPGESEVLRVEVKPK